MSTTMSQPKTRSLADEHVVSVHALSKKYKKGADALKGLDLQINKGDLFGLVGPDGAGKTTALKILSGVMRATSGEAFVMGKAPADARAEIGYVPQNCALYPELSVEENLMYQAGLHGVDDDDIDRLKKTYLESMGLLEFADRLASQLSGGMKQKLALCCALVSSPKLILLDEPTTGLDPIARRELWQALSSLANDGVTAIIATPFLDEAERCNRIALMHDGKIELEGTPKDLQDALHMQRLTFTIKNHEKLNQVPALIANLQLQNIKDIYPFGDRLEILTTSPQEAEAEVRQKFETAGLTLSQAHQSAPSLENVFVIKLQELGSEKTKQVDFPHWRPGEQSQQSDQIRTSDQDQGVAIRAEHLCKTFKDFQAVDDVNLEIKYGEIFGLLGANGAGKTTTIKMLCGLAKPTSGSVMLSGETHDLRKKEVRRNIGYMSQKFTLYDDLTVRENLDFYAGIYEIPFKLRKQQIDWVIEACNLEKIQKSIVRRLPLGWKQRIAFGAAVMHDPKIIFLDEPTAGVDPLARRQLWTLIRDFATNGAAILVTTHYLDEAEFCNRLAFMANSKVITQGTPSEIKSDHTGELYEIITGDTQKSFQVLSESLDHWRVAIFGSSIHVLIDNENEAEKVKSILQNSGVQTHQFRPITFTLEDAFIDVVQRSQRKSA
ncbi:MAG: ATP-binding cassette domain-containing protein [Candidatus Melainabacteria bacterium]|nr:ATP-binding cassette domain-containing protein [Candidatus Melainabacteria bacterium]